MIGLPKPSSFMRVARHRPRAPAMLRPWVVVLERYGGIGSGRAPGAGGEEGVDRRRAIASFADRPDDQRLATPHVATGEDARDPRLIPPHLRLDRAPRRAPHSGPGTDTARPPPPHAPPKHP